jgi:hypothetical protein
LVVHAMSAIADFQNRGGNVSASRYSNISILKSTASLDGSVKEARTLDARWQLGASCHMHDVMATPTELTSPP